MFLVFVLPWLWCAPVPDVGNVRTGSLILLPSQKPALLYHLPGLPLPLSPGGPGVKFMQAPFIAWLLIWHSQPLLPWNVVFHGPLDILGSRISLILSSCPFLYLLPSFSSSTFLLNRDHSQALSWASPLFTLHSVPRPCPQFPRLPSLSPSRSCSCHISTQIPPPSSSPARPPVSHTAPLDMCNTTKGDRTHHSLPAQTYSPFQEDGTTLIPLRSPDQKPLFSMGLKSHLSPGSPHSTRSEYLLHSPQPVLQPRPLLLLFRQDLCTSLLAVFTSSSLVHSDLCDMMVYIMTRWNLVQNFKFSLMS